MNISILGYSETTPTYFTIQVTMGRATFQVRKRYNDFDLFDTKIEQEMGEKPPLDLPSKKWIGNKNREFLDQRRRELELYLRSMAKRDDWRESLVFQEFLEVSKHVKSSGSAGARSKGNWLKGVNEAREHIQLANQAEGADERRYMVLAGAKVKELEALLAGDDGIGDGEYRRRSDVIQELSRSLLNKKSRQQQALLNNFEPNDSLNNSRNSSSIQLFGDAAKNRPTRVLGKGEETDRTRDLTNNQLLSLQQNDMEDQDQMIESLRKIAQRQRQLGEDINEELTYQTQLLEELDQDTHITSSKLNQARRRIGKFT